MHDWSGNERCARKNLIRRLPDAILISMSEPSYPWYPYNPWFPMLVRIHG